MTIFAHEWRMGRLSLAIWTACITALLVVCVFLFPEMKGQMESVGDVFASMGRFTEAFGMDRLNFGTLTGFYAIECGNVVGLGGAFFAALTGAGMLAKEEKNRTAEFLLTHPVSRRRVLTEKLAAMVTQLLAMNLILWLSAVLSMGAIGEEIPWRSVTLMHAAYLLLQLELAGICFGISAFLPGAGAGIGMGLAAGFYFLNLMANMTESVEFLKYITPFGYCEGADIVESGSLDTSLVLPGMALMAIGIAAAYVKYEKKDIR